MSFTTGRYSEHGGTVHFESHRLRHQRVFYDRGELCLEATVDHSPMKGVGPWLPSEGRWDWFFYSDK